MSKDEKKFNIKDVDIDELKNDKLAIDVLEYAIKKGKVTIMKIQKHFGGIGYARVAKSIMLLQKSNLMTQDEKYNHIPNITAEEFYKIFGEKVDLDDDHEHECHCKHDHDKHEHCCKHNHDKEDNIKHDQFGDLYLDALCEAVEHEKISKSFIQRRFSVGFNTASTIVEKMIKDGYISKENDNGYTVKVTKDDLIEKYGDKIKHRLHEPDQCDCGCEHDDDDGDDEVVIEGFKDNKEFQKYEKAFRQLEDALIKADKELTKATKKAEENEHLAITYKKDLERYKERAKEQEKEMKIKAIENVADKIIPILDSFEQALKVGGDKNTIKGFEMIEGMLKNAVKSLGIEEIDAQDKQFDPKLHNAVGKKKTKDKSKDNIVATVYQKGYKLEGSDRVIRHSTVEVYDAD